MDGYIRLANHIPARLTVNTGRRFGITVGTAFLVLGGLVRWRGFDTTSAVLLVTGGALVLAGILIPKHLTPVERAWMKMGLAISRVTTPLLLGIVYFLVITPMGLIRRRVGHSPIVSKGTSSRWVERDDSGRSDLTRQF